jgi:hypothetical protein
MTGKTRMLGAGRAGSTSYGSNVNLVQFGNKLQGLAPQATHFFIAGNGPAGWVNYQTRTYAPKRNFVFCMNRLGGVGRGKSQFKIGGLNNPDGSRSCKPYDYIKQKETLEQKNMITKKLSNKLEKDSNNDLELSTDISENIGKTDSSNDSTSDRFSSIEAVFTFSATSPSDNPPFPQYTKGGIIRITTTYPLSSNDIVTLNEYLSTKNEASFYNSEVSWYYNNYDCTAGWGLGYNSSTTYIQLEAAYEKKVPIDEFRVLLPLDCVYIEYAPTENQSSYQPNFYYNTNIQKIERNLFVAGGDTIYSLSDSSGQTWLDNTKKDIVDSLQAGIESANEYTPDSSQLKTLDLYKLDSESSSSAEGSGGLDPSGCLLTYLFAYTSSIDTSNNILQINIPGLGYGKTIDVLDPYINGFSDNNTGSSSISMNYGDESPESGACGKPMCYDINLLILNFINDLQDASTTPSILFTTNEDLFNQAFDKMPYAQTNSYNLPPFINVDGTIYPLLFNGSDQQYAMLLRFRNSSSNLNTKMIELQCYPNPELNQPVTDQVVDWISVVYNQT